MITNAIPEPPMPGRSTSLCSSFKHVCLQAPPSVGSGYSCRDLGPAWLCHTWGTELQEQHHLGDRRLLGSRTPVLMLQP